MMMSFMHHGISRDDLLTESILQIFVGTETTAIALRLTMSCLIIHPRFSTYEEQRLMEVTLHAKLV